MLSDEQIIKRILDGHIADFSKLMQRHQPAAFRLAYRVLGRREDAEDAVQETFLRVYQYLETCRDTAEPWPWIRRIALNVCLRRIPRERPSEDVEDLLDAFHVGEDPTEARALMNIQADDAVRAVESLPLQYRTVVVLRYLENLSYVEISEMLGCPIGTVKSQLHRALSMLSERLAVVGNEL